MVIKKTKEERQEEKEKDSFKNKYDENEKYILHQSEGLSLKEIIIKIQSDKEYIFNFIKHEKIEEIIKSIKDSYRFNRYEIEDIITVVITEYFYNNKIDIDNYSENNFLFNLKKEIINKTQKEVYHNYSARDIPMSDNNFFEDASYDDDFRDSINTRVDLFNEFSKLSLKSKQVVQLYHIEGYNQTEIAELVCISQQRVSQILFEYKRILKDIL